MAFVGIECFTTPASIDDVSQLECSFFRTVTPFKQLLQAGGVYFPSVR